MYRVRGAVSQLRQVIEGQVLYDVELEQALARLHTQIVTAVEYSFRVNKKRITERKPLFLYGRKVDVAAIGKSVKGKAK